MNSTSFHEKAWAEFVEAAIWYESKEASLGLRFIRAVRETIELIEERPATGSSAPARCRKLRLKGFPYAILYRQTDSEQIVLIAVIHAKRKPNYWRDRVGD